ncbi:PAS domain S-box protein [bacterium]|nr:PAS domain S-box protein [bacterium]MBU1874122.1 PAS domain S-box protein [bacterium]
MRQIQTIRYARGAGDLNARCTTSIEALNRMIQPRTTRNIKRGHTSKGVRDINRIGWGAWEEKVANTLRVIDTQAYDRANSFYSAMDKTQELFGEVRKREGELQVANEEMEANNEELQASNEEMEASNEELQNLTEELEQTSAYQKSLMDSNPDIIMTTDPSGIVTDVNMATERISGYSREKLIGQPFGQFFSDPGFAQTGIEQVIREGRVSNYELTVVTQKGRQVPVSYNATALRDPDGRITGVLGNARDVTSSKQLEEELRKSTAYTRSLIEANFDSLVTISPEGKITDVNESTVKLTGVSREQLIGTDFCDYFTEPEKAREGYQQVLSKDSIMNYQLTINNKSKQELVPVLYNASVYRDEAGNVQGVFAAARDITILNETMAELGRSNLELEQFAYFASHDLQEPLRMVVSYLQLLERRYKGKIDSDADEFIAYAVDGANRMGQLINDLLKFSRVGTESKPFESTDCTAVIDKVLANLEAAVKESGAVVTHDPLPVIMSDDVQLNELFQNLISNAIKFRGEPPPHVHISAKQAESEWIFSVRDDGIGIDPLYKDKIFVIFQRLQDKDYPGTGIGLAVCKKIVEYHGGRIWVESEHGKGATFYFTIPVKE